MAGLPPVDELDQINAVARAGLLVEMVDMRLDRRGRGSCPYRTAPSEATSA